jgi:ATP-binding cassette subfamily F protein 3
MLKLIRLRLARAGKLLIDGADLTLFPGERLALVGANGAGKSTLMAALRGELSAESGDINIPKSWRLSHVAQETPALPHAAVDFVLMGDDELTAIESEIHQLETDPDSDASRLGELYALKQDIDGFSARARVSALLFGLGFSQDDLHKPVADFSGGWRMRLNLARALGSRADLMLLDEPTNHLDIEAVLWLENWLKRCGKTMIVISHDREFLDSVATHTAHLDSGTLTHYVGGYSSFEIQRAEQQRQQNLAAEKQTQEMEKLQRFVDRFRAKASKATQAQSRLKRIEKMQMIATVRQKRSIDLSFLAPEKKPDPLVTLVRADCGYDSDHAILRNATFEVRLGQRIALLGQNGNGKSTLIKSLMGDLPLLNGERQPGNGLQIGYFAQHQVDSLRPDDLAIDHLRRRAPGKTDQHLRDFLGRFGFSGEKASQAIGTLSGGEKARLSLATIIHARPNLLLLDEPTNHLDIETRDALGEALLEFEGAMVLVSHDRHLLESVTDSFLRVHGGTVKPFDDDLDRYAETLAREASQANAANAPDAADVTGQKDARTAVVLQDAAAVAAVARKPRLADSENTETDRKSLQQRRNTLQNEKKALQRKIAQQEDQLGKGHERIKALDALLARDDAYSDQRRTETQNISQERHALGAELAAVEEAWLDNTVRLESIEDSIHDIDHAHT